MAHQGVLPPVHRHVTTHNEQGQSIISSTIPVQCNFYSAHNNIAAFSQVYVTEGFPVDLNNDKDLETYTHYLNKPPGLVNHAGTVLRYVDMAPGSLSPMHRTLSLDFGVVLEGKVELVLDSGETRLMTRRDVCVQRGTKHAWRNTSDTEWARVLFVLQPAKPMHVQGQELKEDLEDMQGVRPSS